MMAISCPLGHTFAVDEIMIIQCISIHHYLINEEITVSFQLAMSVSLRMVQIMKTKISPY